MVIATAKESILCTSESLLESMENPSPFCVISGELNQSLYHGSVIHNSRFYAGIVNTYLLVQITFWGTFHTLGLTWGVVFPFHYRRFKAEGKVKYIHTATVILGLVLPAISTLVPLIDGYTVVLSSAYDCVTPNMATTFFATILPVTSLLAVSCIALVVLFRSLFKVTMHDKPVQLQNSYYLAI